MKLKPITEEHAQCIQRAEELAREAQQMLRWAGANKAADAIARARKSIGGAIRHAERKVYGQDEPEPKPTRHTLTASEAVQIVSAFRSILYWQPSNILDPNKEWSADTVEYLAGTLEDAGLVPHEEEPFQEITLESRTLHDSIDALEAQLRAEFGSDFRLIVMGNGHEIASR